jgi:hypothetical protein
MLVYKFNRTGISKKTEEVGYFDSFLCKIFSPGHWDKIFYSGLTANFI